jgi:hypothetical protein
LIFIYIIPINKLLLIILQKKEKRNIKMSYAKGVLGTYTGQNLFEVTPEKSMCLWPNTPDAKNANLGCYCCRPGTVGRPVSFQYTPDAERWKCCSKFRGCVGKPKIGEKGKYGRGIC